MRLHTHRDESRSRHFDLTGEGSHPWSIDLVTVTVSGILDDRFREICVVEQAELVERTACWRIPRLRSAKQGAVSWQDGGERSNWQ